MFSRILGLVGGKWSFVAIIAAAITIAGLYGYIRYQSAKLDAAQSHLDQAKRDVADRDKVISVQQQEGAQYEARVKAMSEAMEQMSGAMARNSQQRRTDYGNMTRPHPLPGVSADTKELETAANTGMNSLFAELVRLSQPPVSNPVQDKPHASK